MSELRRVALVTGAGTGIGRAVAMALLKSGYVVILTGRHVEKLEETRRLSGVDEASTLLFSCDVADEVAVQELFSKIQARFGRLDLLFNNAGTVAPPVPIDELPIGVWKRVVDTNLTGAFLFTRAAVHMMKRQVPRGGRIINNGSISALTPRPNATAYNATKHAITGLTKSVALDGRQFDIACGQIDIGNAATEMTSRMPTGVPQPSGELMVEPTFDVAHVASAVMYMANLPLDANVLFMTVMATKMPFVGRG